MAYLPGLPLADVYAGHVQALASEGAARGATALTQTAETFREVLVYDQRIFQRVRLLLWRSACRASRARLRGTGRRAEFSAAGKVLVGNCAISAA